MCKFFNDFKAMQEGWLKMGDGPASEYNRSLIDSNRPGSIWGYAGYPADLRQNPCAYDLRAGGLPFRNEWQRNEVVLSQVLCPFQKRWLSEIFGLRNTLARGAYYVWKVAIRKLPTN